MVSFTTIIDEKYEYSGEKSLIDRLLKYVYHTDIISNSRCWIWNGNLHKDGYGYLTVQVSPTYRRPVGAHRLSYAAFKGPIDSGKLVCHTCDNRRCINPLHLFLGTPKENSLDAKKKGRFPNGETHYAVKLSAVDIARIRESTLPDRVLAKEYGVAHSHIRNIRHYKKWSASQL